MRLFNTEWLCARLRYSIIKRPRGGSVKDEAVKGQLISKANCQAEDSTKKRTNEFVFTSMRHVFVRFFLKNPRPEKNVSRLSDL